MIDLNIIKERYASMTDEQLIYLAKEDSRGLTEEAITILKQEFARRNLNMDVFVPIEKEQTEEEQRGPIEGFYNPATSADDAILGRNYMRIKNPALEKEQEENEKTYLENLSSEQIQELIRKCDKAMLINGIIFIAGIGVTLATYLAVAEKGGSYFVAWGAVVFGGYRFFKAFDAKNKYKALLNGTPVQKEESPVDDSGEKNNQSTIS